MLIITENASNKIAEILKEESASSDNKDIKVRVFVQGGGCSGFEYGFTFDEAQNEDDFNISVGSNTLLVDAMSAQYLQGAEIDYIDSINGSQFKIKNPNAQTTCGCGSSFSPF